MHIESRHEIGSPEPQSKLRRMRVSVIREEFLALTGHAYKAILLNQLYYWTQKVKDFDEMLQEEKNRDLEMESELRHGWIYKSAPDFLKETLLTVSKYTFYRHMNYLIEKGWVETKDHPTHAWDKTTFYRLNLEKIYHDLQLLGYELPAVFQETYQKMAQTFMLHSETSKLQNATYNKITDKNEDQNDLIFFKDSYTEKSVRAGARDINDIKSQEENEVSDIKTFIEIWNETVKKELPLASHREESLKEVIRDHFHNNDEEWIEFCEKVKTNDSLMGDNPSKWCICLDWAAQSKNIVKIIKRFKETERDSQPVLMKKDEALIEEALTHIEKIQDHIWKETCKKILHNWGPGANVRYDSPYYEGLYKKKGQSRSDLETFLVSKLWEAKVGSINDKVALLWMSTETEFYYKTYYQEATLTILSEISPVIRRVTWTTDQKRFDDHWQYFEDREGEKRRDG